MTRFFKLALLFFSTFLANAAFALMFPVSLDDLNKYADIVVVIRVTDVQAKFIQVNKDAWKIETTSTFAVQELVRGEIQNEFEITLPGGKVGEKGMWVEHIPDFQEGEQYILFLRKDGPNYFPLYGEAGVYKLNKTKIEKTSQEKSDFLKPFLKNNSVSQNQQITSQQSHKNIWGCSLSRY